MITARLHTQDICFPVTVGVIQTIVWALVWKIDKKNGKYYKIDKKRSWTEQESIKQEPTAYTMQGICGYHKYESI